jgi:hypothetical protein
MHLPTCYMWYCHSGVMNITVVDMTPCCLAGDLTCLSSWVSGGGATLRVNFYCITKHYIPEGSHLHCHRHVNLKSCIVIVYGRAFIRLNFRENLKSHSYLSWHATLCLFYPEYWSNSSKISVNYQTTQLHILEASFLFFLVQPSVICVSLA